MAKVILLLDSMESASARVPAVKHDLPDMWTILSVTPRSNGSLSAINILESTIFFHLQYRVDAIFL